jgi:hypothetical protein
MERPPFSATPIPPLNTPTFNPEANKAATAAPWANPVRLALPAWDQNRDRGTTNPDCSRYAGSSRNPELGRLRRMMTKVH